MVSSVNITSISIRVKKLVPGEQAQAEKSQIYCYSSRWTNFILCLMLVIIYVSELLY